MAGHQIDMTVDASPSLEFDVREIGPDQAQTRVRFVCSLAQRRFWVLERLDPGNPALNVAVRWQLEGDISAPRLEAAWRLVVKRHDVLRTFFVAEDGEPAQFVEPAIDFRVPVIELTMLAESEATEQADRLASQEARRPFNLGIAPLIRVSLLRLTARRSVVLLTAHHIICDGWSIGLLAAEMGEAYAALEEHRPPALPELPIQYGEFTEWQREALESSDLEDATKFWERSLKGLRHFELLPDHARPPVQTANSNIVSILLDRGLTNRVAALAREHGCSMFMTALAALLVLLRRQSGEDDIVVGTQVAGRDHVEVESLVGLFINTLVLRTDLSGQPTFPELLARVREGVSLAFEHRKMPLERVIEIVNPERDLSRNPLFSVNFIFQRSFIQNETYGGLRLVDMPSRSAGALYDLNFFMVERPDGWRASCEYNTDLFEQATVTALLRRFETVLRGIAADPARPISAIPVMTEAERQTLLTDWNRTEAAYPADQTVVQLFEAQVARAPDATAVVCGPRTMTYQELNAAADTLAERLQAQGVAPGKRIGVLLERSADLVVALLAVLKSGSAYVPLDPAYPAARLIHVVKDGALAALVTRSDLHERVDVPGLPLVMIDASIDAPPASHVKDGGVPHGQPAAPDDIAYAIYTSGSTGLPKGVQIRHRSLVNLLWAMREKPGLQAGDTLLSVTTIAFDIAALEVFLPLIVGARLVIAREHETVGTELLRVLRRSGATVMQATPVTWQLLLDAGWIGDPPLKMLCGGEALPRKLANRLLDTGGELWNMYGPTETTIWSSALRVEPSTDPVPIGPPIANTQFYVADQEGTLVPPGAPGELLIGGDGVAAGYIGQPELTRERFISDPFRSDPAARLYRTGDLVRLRGSGNLEFLGRSDNQIKLRGFRIELGEIEVTLLRHPDVTDAVAVIGRDPSGEAGIHAYVTMGAQAPIPASMLRAWVGQSLPSYMVPSFVGFLPALPRTPNGKIDRRSLPAPSDEEGSEASGSESGEEAGPADDIHHRLVAIWRGLLGVHDITPASNFFELGGNSLLAARLIARIETEFERRISLASLFQAATIGELAALLRQPAQTAFEFDHVLRLRTGATKPELMAISNTGAFYIFSRRLSAAHSFTGLQLFDPSLEQEPPQTFKEIAAAYVRLIERVDPTGPYVLLGWCIAGAVALEAAHQLRARNREVRLVVLIDTWVPGYMRRLSRSRAWLAGQSYRWHTIVSDCTTLLSGKRSLSDFLSRRNIYKRVTGELGGSQSASADDAVAEHLAGRRYHEEILDHLRAASTDYDPAPYDGHVILFTATDEPQSRFLDPTQGWKQFMTGRFDVIPITGDHSSIFQDPGARQMAEIIEATISE
jgi:amino acid adenylation domain-containing protein